MHAVVLGVCLYLAPNVQPCINLLPNKYTHIHKQLPVNSINVMVQLCNAAYLLSLNVGEDNKNNCLAFLMPFPCDFYRHDKSKSLVLL